MALHGFLAGATVVASGSPLAPTYGVGAGTTAVIFDNDGSVITAPSSIYQWIPNAASRVALSPTSTPCALQVALIAKLADDFNSQLSRSDGDQIQWTFV